MASLLKRLKGVVAQVNPFDDNQTYSTVVNNQKPQPRPVQNAPQQQQAPQQQSNFNKAASGTGKFLANTGKGLASSFFETASMIPHGVALGVGNVAGNKAVADRARGALQQDFQGSIPGAVYKPINWAGNVIGAGVASRDIEKALNEGRITPQDAADSYDSLMARAGEKPGYQNLSTGQVARKTLGNTAQITGNLLSLGEGAAAKSALGGLLKAGGTNAAFAVPAVAAEDNPTLADYARGAGQGFAGGIALGAGGMLLNKAVGRPTIETPSVAPKARPNEMAVLSDLQDVNYGNIKNPRVIRQTIEAAQPIADRLGIDIRTGTPADISARITQTLEQSRPVAQVQSPTARQTVQNLPDLNSSSPGIVARIKSKMTPLNEGGYIQTPGKTNTVNNPYIIAKTNPTDISKMSSKDLQYYAEKGHTSITDRYGNTKELTPTSSPNEGKLNSLNPTGGVFVDYSPKTRATMPLGSDMTTLDRTLKVAPNKEVTIYRGAPSNQTKIVPGDFITTNRELAKSYAGDGNVIETRVPASHILDSKSSPLGDEYLYRPTTKKKSLTEKLGLKPLNEVGAIGRDVRPDVPDPDMTQRLVEDYLKSPSRKVPKSDTSLTGAGAELPSVMTKAQRDALLAKTRAEASTAAQPELSIPSVSKRTSPQRTDLNPLNTESASLSGKLPENISPSLPGKTGKSGSNPSQVRNRGFIDTITEDPTTSPKLRQQLSDLDNSYQVRNTKDLQTKAANLVKDSPDTALRVALGDKSDIGVSVGSELITKLQKDGNYEQAINVANTLAKNLTEAGRTAQAASIYGKLTPEGVLRFTQKEINKYNESTGKSIKLGEDTAKKLTERAKRIQELPEGKAKQLEVAKLKKDVYDTMPATAPQVLGTLQTMAQLLNPKTIIRNLGGNSMFAGLENVSQVLGAGLDKGISAVRGSERTVGLPNLKRQAKAGIEGFKEEYSLAKQGLDVGNKTQFELGDQRTFKKGVLGAGETTMNIVLRAPDEAARRAAYFDTIEGLKKANKTTVATPAMEDAAQAMGLYRTFQDNSKAAELFTALKKTLNKAGVERNGKRFGLGDFILKYPKTPGNILARGIDYSPAGIFKGVYEIAKPVFGKEFDQAKFVNNVSRGTVGSASLVGAGTVLGALGIITQKPEQDTDLRGLQKKSGQGGYQINTSALKRFILSGFNKDSAKIQSGDKLVSYDWAQPAAIPLSMGAGMGRKDSAGKSTKNIIGGVAEGVNTLADQPLVQGVQQFFGTSINSSKSGFDKIVDTAKGIPASFTPTLVNQIGQLTDNTSRNTYNSNPGIEALNKVKARIPGVRTTLPARVDSLGDPQQTYQNNSNNPFNVFLNPAFVSNYTPSPEAKLALDIYQRSGETKQAPRMVTTTQQVNGSSVKITAQQQGDLQTYIGQKTKDFFGKLNNDGAFLAKSDEDKAKIMSNGLADIVKAGKVNVLGDSVTKGTSTNTKTLINGGTSLNYSNSSAAKTYKDQYDAAVKKFNDEQSTYSPVTRQQKQQDIASLAVKKDFDKDTVDLYGMSKAKALDFADSQADPQSYKDKLIAYGDALVKSGQATYNKYRDKNGNLTLTKKTSSKGSKKGRKTGSKKAKKAPFSTAGFKTARIGRVKAPKLSVRKASYKRYTPTKAKVA